MKKIVDWLLIIAITIILWLLIIAIGSFLFHFLDRMTGQ